MNRLAWSQIFTLCCLIPLASLGVSSKLRSQESPQFEEGIVFNEAFEPLDGDRPETRGGGSRGKCQQDKDPEFIYSLMPEINYGLTLEERPAIFINMPETSAQNVWLAFQDAETGENGDRIAMLPIAQKSGIVRFSLPETTSPLTVGKRYSWILVVVCGDTLNRDDPTFRGWVRRVEKTAEIETILAEKNIIERAKWYADRGYWYDLLTILARGQNIQGDTATATLRDRTQLTTQLWQDLLISVGLAEASDRPLLWEN